MREKKEEGPSCRFNSNISCADKVPNCQKCGWNPKVDTKRKKKGVVNHGKL